MLYFIKKQKHKRLLILNITQKLLYSYDLWVHTHIYAHAKKYLFIAQFEKHCDCEVRIDFKISAVSIHIYTAIQVMVSKNEISALFYIFLSFVWIVKPFSGTKKIFFFYAIFEFL